MPLRHWLLSLPIGIAIALNSTHAVAASSEVIQLTQCLASHLTDRYQTLADNKQFKIIRLPTERLEQVIRIADNLACGRFVNLTQELPAQSKTLTQQKQWAAKLLQSKPPVLATVVPRPYSITHQQLVEQYMEEVSTDNIMATLEHLTEYPNRAPNRRTGLDAIHWIDKTFNEYAIENKRDDVFSYYVKTGHGYKQPSLVTVIGKDADAPGIVIGAHIDTLDGSRMPGAGDDGSGSASLLEIARVLLSSPTELKRPIYLIWYAAEEQGLVGSQQVVKHFIRETTTVDAVMQLDMTGYRYQDDPTIWIYRDYTHKELSDFVANLVQEYLNVPVADSECGYGCSDHASWDARGIPAVFPTEAEFSVHNPNIHTAEDTIDKLTPEHMTNFAKLGLAFALELAAK